nr:MAG TPA: hypothetical protein [Bacteriophage sp.]DAO84984.1 MAG TPA: hypothetical protein [Caudoviricetes sp.]DAY88039.1 MAG TPA: hypothetical protein [Caudoviricetes sp.]
MKGLGLSYHEVLHEISWLNIQMLLKCQPSYSTDKDKPKQVHASQIF